MISTDSFHFIHQRLCSIANNTLPFGGYNIILFGDFYQLRPVRGKHLFTDNILWPIFQPYFLKQNQRQSGDNTFIALLNNIRIGKLTESDLSILKSRLTTNDAQLNQYVHIYPTNDLVLQHNLKMQNLLCLNYHISTA